MKQLNSSSPERFFDREDEAKESELETKRRSRVHVHVRPESTREQGRHALERGQRDEKPPKGQRVLCGLQGEAVSIFSLSL